MHLGDTDGFRDSFFRIRAWGEAKGYEVVHVKGALGGLHAGSMEFGLETDATPVGRVGAGVGWTVELASGRHHGAFREAILACDIQTPAEQMERMQADVREICETEVAAELNKRSDWSSAGSVPVTHLTNDNFYETFLRDLDEARESVLILSPFLGHRLGQLVDPLVRAKARGVDILILTRDMYVGKDWAQPYLDALKSAAITVAPRSNRVHEKVIVIDKEVAYNGSLNSLSHKFTLESVLRFECPIIASGFSLEFDPRTGQGFAERIETQRAPGKGHQEVRTAWGEVPQDWR